MAVQENAPVLACPMCLQLKAPIQMRIEAVPCALVGESKVPLKTPELKGSLHGLAVGARAAHPAA